MKRYVVIVAGGAGRRFGADVPKQFQLLGGKPLLMHTIEAFANQKPEIEIIIVLPGEHIQYWLDICEEFAFPVHHSVFAGGNFRGESVRLGIDAITDREALVAVHDGVRPFVDTKIILEGFNLASVHGNAVPVCEISDSVRIVENGVNLPFNRNLIRSIQTPQCFRLSILREAYNSGNIEGYTDDAGLVERLGHKIHLFEGNPENIKITTPFDLLVAGVVLNNRKT